MSSENKELIRRWYEQVWNQGRADVIDSMLAPDAVIHGLGNEVHGADVFKSFHAAYRRTFPDIHFTIGDVLGDGDLVAARWTATATHRGDGLGIAATSRSVRFGGMGFVRIAGGRIIDAWNSFDELSLMQQIGAVEMRVDR